MFRCHFIFRCKIPTLQLKLHNSDMRYEEQRISTELKNCLCLCSAELEAIIEEKNKELEKKKEELRTTSAQPRRRELHCVSID